ncbi:hypothetical protein K474DRAFT_1708742 [Panus rudis PR-1116 ss-1]|nr:hypothetical protein K474DRAFT_1708742 [Panus rudis PR-1116 ss-1]
MERSHALAYDHSIAAACSNREGETRVAEIPQWHRPMSNDHSSSVNSVASSSEMHSQPHTADTTYPSTKSLPGPPHPEYDEELLKAARLLMNMKYAYKSRTASPASTTHESNDISNSDSEMTDDASSDSGDATETGSECDDDASESESHEIDTPVDDPDDFEEVPTHRHRMSQSGRTKGLMDGVLEQGSSKRNNKSHNSREYGRPPAVVAPPRRYTSQGLWPDAYKPWKQGLYQ